jgi:molecular chaperone IbpA|tara:strand:+ start:25842 stop:26267 length:426 start_codon:yes stop_codon:yes gene_type:complete
MKTLTTLDLQKIAPYAVGFDRIISDMFQYADNNVASTGYPPYNIRKEGDKFQIEIALAGVTKEDLEINLEEGQLTISHDPEETQVDVEYLHKGIAQRKFKRVWTLSDDVVVNGAQMENGMLYVELERIVPEEKKARSIKIK